jgi:hypothetical protein
MNQNDMKSMIEQQISILRHRRERAWEDGNFELSTQLEFEIKETEDTLATIVAAVSSSQINE